MKTQSQRNIATSGGTLIASLLIITALAAMAAVLLNNVLAKYRTNFQAVAWRDALVSAEAGVERAMAELRRTIDDPEKAWDGWVVLNADGTPAVSQTINRTTPWTPGYALRMSATLPSQPNEAKPQKFSVIVDIPSTLAVSGRRWNPSYRIRSTGYSVLPGGTRLADDDRDTKLRRLSLIWDRRTNTRLASTPEASRTLEIVARPNSVYDFGLIAEINFKMNQKTFIDGYHSGYPDASTNGKYDPLKRTQKGGTVLANRWKKNSKPDPADQIVEKFDIGKATIYGDLLVKGSLKNVKNYENVLGSKVTNVSEKTPTNRAPSWLAGVTYTQKLDGKIPSALQSSYRLAEKQSKAGGPEAQFAAKSATAAAVLAAKGMEIVGSADRANPTRIKVETIEVDKKDESLVFNNPPGVSESWVELWVTKETKISKGGTLFVSNGVHATIFVEGKVEIKETKLDPSKDPNAFYADKHGGFILESGYAADLQIIGLEKSENFKETDDEFSPKKRSGKIIISDADFTGVINAPDWDVEFKPKDWDKEDTVYGGQLFGSVVGRKVKIGNGADYHYDEALGDSGKVLNYSIVGWNEI